MIALLKNQKVLLLFRIVIGIIFILAGIEKIANPEGFAISIENYKVLPVQIVNLLAIPLPWIELIPGLFLLFGISVKENSLIINSLLIVFIILVLTAVLRGLDIECGCFGTFDGHKVGVLKISENTILLLMGIAVYYFDKDPISIK